MAQEDQNVTPPEDGANKTQETSEDTSLGGANQTTGGLAAGALQSIGATGMAIGEALKSVGGASSVSPQGQVTATIGATQGVDQALQTMQIVDSLALSTATAQQEFDNLVARKEALWNSISRNQLYELTAEWKEIQVIDERLHVLWGDGKNGIVRKEDK